LLERVDLEVRDLFEFAGERCNRVVAGVMAQLATET
jgi:hypothetical protein